MLLIGILLGTLSCVFWTLSMVRLTRANPTERVPFWGRPRNDPAKRVLLLALGSITLIFSAQFGVMSLGRPVGLLLMLPAVVVPFVVLGRHNGKFAAAD